ncbi:hypothetical protein DV737_g3561, partial [Chaetothyriales sp. CBS 132003]
MRETYFQHERLRLSDQSIRLVQIQGSSSASDILSLRITQFSKLKRPPYTAISYTWGSSSQLLSIQINGRSFKIHLNLWHLLRHLRERGESRFLWIDALCIDQAYLPERNFHVQLMNKIYEDAEFAIVWLGLPSDERREARAMDFVQEMARHQPEKSGASFRDVYLSMKMKLRWVNLLRFCNLTYWTRCWIIQEFLQAKRIEVLCGTARLEWTYFEKVFLDIRNLDTYPDYLALELKDFLTTVPSRLTARRLLHRTSRLEELLHEFYDAQCSEPRDKVYGLLGIAQDCGEHVETGELKGPQPDYGQHIVQVYFDVVRYLSELSPSGAVAPCTALLLQKALAIDEAAILEFANMTWSEGLYLRPSAFNFHLCPDYISAVSAALPSDLIGNTIAFAETSSMLSLLFNYSQALNFRLPLEYLNMHIEDKRAVSNPNFQKPTLIIETSPSAEPVRVGFACTNVRKGDYILQFNGLDIALIGPVVYA